ncbi:hypothetical protein FOZ60_002058 [Perkinsus olseni]|uniref:Uncharacterized protein n=1 Tax=Perkinsus olseni TaxID=32597 RepID=A0A7J6NZ52_PEROL|nr:hypothetical protein FOZ60_002058 [Perkinsus olseni]
MNLRGRPRYESSVRTTMPPFVSNYQRYIAVYGGEDSEKKPTGLMMGNLTLPEGYMVHYEPSGSSRIIREPDRDFGGMGEVSSEEDSR